MSDAGPHDPTAIDAAVDSYAARAGNGTGGAPYDAASLAEIYAPRVRQLFDLRGQGFTLAYWGWDAERGENRWHGIDDPPAYRTYAAMMRDYRRDHYDDPEPAGP